MLAAGAVWHIFGFLSSHAHVHTAASKAAKEPSLGFVSRVAAATHTF